MTHSRKRIGLAAATAAASMATVFALPGTADAAAVHPDAVKNATAKGGAGVLTIDWDAPDTGEPATSYVVVIFTDAGVQVGAPHIVLAPETKLELKDVTAGNYYAEIYSHNAYPGYGGPTGTVTVAVTAPAAPVAPVRSTNPYRPYKSWDDLIDQEYRFWTGCSPVTTEVGGRLPRDDEFTFWRQYLTSPLDLRIDSGGYPVSEDGEAYWNAFAERSAAEWQRLTNSATFAPPAVIVTPGYENSVAYKALYDIEYKRLTSIPSGGGAIPADFGYSDPGTPAADNGIANNNLLEADELLWARYHADQYARQSANLLAKYAADVNTLAAKQATDDAYFARRLQFVKSLAEDAEQTDGPAYRLYTAYFSRIPDAKGLCFWTDKLRSGWSLLDVSEFFVQSDEFEATYGKYDSHGGEDSIDAAEFVSLVYRNVLDRTPDGAGAAFWTRQLQEERYSPAEMLIGFSESLEFKERMETKVGTGVAFIHLLGRMPTQTEYVWGDLFWNNAWFAPTPIWSYAGDRLYAEIVDGFDVAPGEYTKRAGIEIPAHHHPHANPGTQPLS